MGPRIGAPVQAEPSPRHADQGRGRSVEIGLRRQDIAIDQAGDGQERGGRAIDIAGPSQGDGEGVLGDGQGAVGLGPQRVVTGGGPGQAGRRHRIAARAQGDGRLNDIGPLQQLQRRRDVIAGDHSSQDAAADGRRGPVGAGQARAGEAQGLGRDRQGHRRRREHIVGDQAGRGGQIGQDHVVGPHGGVRPVGHRGAQRRREPEGSGEGVGPEQIGQAEALSQRQAGAGAILHRGGGGEAQDPRIDGQGSRDIAGASDDVVGGGQAGEPAEIEGIGPGVGPRGQGDGLAVLMGGHAAVHIVAGQDPGQRQGRGEQGPIGRGAAADGIGHRQGVDGQDGVGDARELVVDRVGPGEGAAQLICPRGGATRQSHRAGPLRGDDGQGEAVALQHARQVAADHRRGPVGAGRVRDRVADGQGIDGEDTRRVPANGQRVVGGAAAGKPADHEIVGSGRGARGEGDGRSALAGGDHRTDAVVIDHAGHLPDGDGEGAVGRGQAGHAPGQGLLRDRHLDLGDRDAHRVVGEGGAGEAVEGQIVGSGAHRDGELEAAAIGRPEAGPAAIQARGGGEGVAVDQAGDAEDGGRRAIDIAGAGQGHSQRFLAHGQAAIGIRSQDVVGQIGAGDAGRGHRIGARGEACAGLGEGARLSERQGGGNAVAGKDAG